MSPSPEQALLSGLETQRLAVLEALAELVTHTESWELIHREDDGFANVAISHDAWIAIRLTARRAFLLGCQIREIFPTQAQPQTHEGTAL